MSIRTLSIALCGLFLLALGVAANAAAYRVDALITLCTGTCDSFASLDVGSEITGTIEIDTAPNSGWGFTDVGGFGFEVFNPAAPIVPWDGTNPDTANPLPLDETVTQVGEVGFAGAMTGGDTDVNNELEGTILFEFIVPPFNSNLAWTIFNIGPGGDLFGQVCLFYTISGCIPGATEAVNFEGTIALIPTLSAFVSGIDARFALCRNLTDPQTVTMSLPQPGLEASWDCETLGMTVSPGDNVILFVRGTNFTPAFAGNANRLGTGGTAICRNVTQGAVVQTPLGPDGSFDCAAAGLPLANQDNVLTIVRGRAQ